MEARENKPDIGAVGALAECLWTFLMGFSNSLPAECLVAGETLQKEKSIAVRTEPEENQR